MFDHMSNSTELPTLRRLQARAAKSAIKRVQELYDVETARKDLESISDPVERNKRKALLRQQVDDKIQHMASRLTELIPNDRALGNQQKAHVELLRNFRKTSNSELMFTAPVDENSLQSPILQNYTRNTPPFDIDYLNPMGNTTTAEDLASEEEFLEAWKRQQAGRNRNSNENDQDTMETFLA